MQAYTEMPATTRVRPERRGISRRTVIDEAKAKVKTIELAESLCGSGRMQGSEWVARCPLPDHEERTPSFTVNPDKDVWWCHGCLRGGDVIELARYAWGYDKGEVAVAAAYLLMEFGHPIPERPPSWYRKQKRQTPVRDAIEEVRVGHLQRRMFRRFLPLLETIEDERERGEEAAVLWEAAGQIAGLVWDGRRGA